MAPAHRRPWRGQSHRDGKWLVGAGGWGGELVFDGDRLSVWGDATVLEADGGDGRTVVQTCQFGPHGAHPRSSH